MFTKTRSSSATVAAVAAALVFVGASSAFALSVFDIEFPVAELGGCADKDACKAYCNEPEHAGACSAFAEKYGLGGPSETKKDFRKFAEAVEADGGPDGKCGRTEDPIRACESVCNEQTNMKACLEYAISRNLIPEQEVAQSRKVLGALNRGIKPPCENGRACRDTCENPKDLRTAKTCFAFAREAGLLPEHVDPAQAEKMFELMEKGEIQFQSPREFEKCENPEDDETLKVCIEIGVKLGVVSADQAEMIKKTGGKGPGGCRGRACEKFCDDPAHEEECFKFAEEYGLFSPEEKTRMEEGMQKFREGLEKAPPEVAECLKNTVGSEVLDGLRAGTKRPSRDLGDKMRSCFEQFMKPPQGMGGPGGGMPPEVQACLKAKGIDFENLQGPPPEDIIRGCFQQFGPQGVPGEDGVMRPSSEGGFPGSPGGLTGPGGCTTPEECQNFCSSNPEACNGFGPSSEKRMMQEPSGEFVPGESGEGQYFGSPNGEFGMPPGMGPEEFKQFEGAEPGQLPPEQTQQFKDQYNQQYQQQYQDQFQRQYQEQYQQQFQNQIPQGGSYPGGQFGPPPEGGFQEPPPPQSLKLLNPPSLLGFFAQIFLGLGQ